MPTQTLRADRDAYVAADAPATNFGGEPVLEVASGWLLSPRDRRLLCGFDLAALPPGAVRVVAARLRLVPLVRTRGRWLRCHEVVGAWTEMGVIWENQPWTGADHGAQPSGLAVQEWDVTSSAQAALPRGRASYRIRDDAEGTLLWKVQRYPARERGGGVPAELVVTFEEQRVAALPTTVRVGIRNRTLALPSTVQPAWSGRAALLSTVVPRERAADPGPDPGAASQGGPPDMPPSRDGLGAVAARDFLRLSEEVGSDLTLTSGGAARRLRRIVQVIDRQETQSFPRPATSEHGKPSTQDMLRRGDAILYAAGSDEVRTGDAVTWQGWRWEVVGTLGGEVIGDVPVYQEVGLRRGEREQGA